MPEVEALNCFTEALFSAGIYHDLITKLCDILEQNFNIFCLRISITSWSWEQILIQIFSILCLYCPSWTCGRNVIEILDCLKCNMQQHGLRYSYIDRSQWSESVYLGIVTLIEANGQSPYTFIEVHVTAYCTSNNLIYHISLSQLNMAQ